MGKLTVMLSEKMENDLRRYVAKRYPTETYGKISYVIEQALIKYIQDNPAEEP